MMQRYTLTSYEQAGAETREIYDEYLRLSGAMQAPIWMTSLGHNPTLLKAYWAKTRGCLIEGSLPRILKELVIFVVSCENGSAYCRACHAHAVLRLDKTLSYPDLLNILHPDSQVSLPAAYRVALEFAAKMARDANAVSDEDFLMLADVGYSAEEIKELLGVIDLAMMFNCYTSALRLPIDPEYQATLAR